MGIMQEVIKMEGIKECPNCGYKQLEYRGTDEQGVTGYKCRKCKQYYFEVI